MGEWVMLTGQKGKKWLVRIEEGPFSCHIGTVQMGDVLAKEEGDFLETSKGAKLYLFRPTLQDYIFSMKRHTQIIYPKDLASLIFNGDIRPGDVILESGIGSGALSLALLRALSGTGMLISVEKRPEFAAGAKENIRKFFGGDPPNHQIIVGDIQDFWMRGKVDRVFFDLPEPWHAIAPISRLMREGSLLLSLSPNVGQVQLMYKELKANGFANAINYELIQREWMIDERRARPTDRMRAHTGFLTVAKKTPAILEEEPVEESRRE